MNWTPDQQMIIDARNCNLLVSAAAGSGKTAVLVERIIRMISDRENPLNVDELLVVTFTKAAAAQMKDKIRNAVENLLEKEPHNQHYQRQLHLVQQANILTIDSFCFRIVKEYFHALSIDPGIRVGETGELALLRGEVLESVIEEYYENCPDFVAFSDCYCADKSDARMEDYILKIYEVSSSYPRPFEWTKSARKDLCVACEEEFMKLSYVQHFMKQVRDTACSIRDKIVLALEDVRKPGGPIYMEPALLSDIDLVDSISTATTYVRLNELCGIKFANIGRGKKGTYDEDVAEEIKAVRDIYKTQIKNLLVPFSRPFEKVLSQLNDSKPRLEAILDATDEFRRRFLDAKLSKNILEFSDVEHLALQVVCEGYDENGMPLPSAIGKEIARGFREILIDEYQDSNYLQEDILRCVSRLSEGEYNLFMVGDVKQSIYSFRMARPDLFMYKFDHYSVNSEAHERKLLLKHNFRSRANLLSGINYIFYQIMGEDLGGIEYTKDQALVPQREFVPYDEDSVELLIGESMGFDYASKDAAEVTGVKEENLDENLEDLGRIELEATIVANRIRELMGEDGKRAYQVTDEDTGTLRDVRYGDIVLLFRAPSSFAQIFREIFSGYGIPVALQSDAGYLDTTEIHEIISLLRTLDNNRNEVELVATLRSYFGGFNDADLANLVLYKRRIEKEQEHGISLYETLLYVSRNDDTSLGEKCRNMESFLNELYECLNRISLGDLYHKICFETGYYYYVEAMPEGNKRARNLRLFSQEIASFEENCFHSLFEFLRYMDQIIKKEIPLGGDGDEGAADNQVRIMSIHKSKGLEFPVVFLCGMGKGFNLQDGRETFIVHSDYHLSAKYADPEKRCGNDTFSRQVFGQLMRMEQVAEELRIFYVGLTRAKEKLIMTGVTRDIPKLINGHVSIARRKEIPLRFMQVGSAGSYLELAVAALIRNREFHQSMCEVRKRFDKEGKLVSAAYEQDVVLSEPSFRLKVKTYDFESVSVIHIQRGQMVQQKRVDCIRAWEDGKKDQVAIIQKSLDFQYPYLIDTKQKSKMSVTEIKRIYETGNTEDEKNLTMDKEHYIAPIPFFLESEQIVTAARRGTLVHKALELFDFSRDYTRDSIQKWLCQIVEQGRLPKEIFDILTVDNILGLLQTKLGRRMQESARKGKLFKEKKFVVGMNPEVSDGKNITCVSRSVVVQGIIDVYFEEEDNIILIDYKTDRIKDGQEDMLVERYKTQLQYYKDTLEQLTGKPVTETYIYALQLNREIRVC